MSAPFFRWCRVFGCRGPQGAAGRRAAAHQMECSQTRVVGDVPRGCGLILDGSVSSSPIATACGLLQAGYRLPSPALALPKGERGSPLRVLKGKHPTSGQPTRLKGQAVRVWFPMALGLCRWRVELGEAPTWTPADPELDPPGSTSCIVICAIAALFVTLTLLETDSRHAV